MPKNWRVHNPSGNKRVIVTKELPGVRWLEKLTTADCKVEICTSTEVLSVSEIKAAMGSQCDGAIGQLTEDWGDELFAALKNAGGKAYSNYAVGFNNVVIVPHIASATSWTRQGMATLAAGNVAGILMGYPVWNQPDILPFLETGSPKAVPSIVNAEALGLPRYEGS